MKNSYRVAKMLLVLLLRFSVIVFLSFALNGIAKERVMGIGQSVYEVLTEAQTKAENKEYAEAIAILDSIEKKISAYERAHIHNLKGGIYQQNDQHKLALSEYAEALKQEGLPPGFRIRLLSQLAQLYLVAEEYQKALEHAEQVLTESKTPYPDAYILAAQASYYLEKYTTSRTYIEKAIELDSVSGKKPRENWLLLANAVYYAMNDFDSMVKLQYQLLDLYPKDRYLVNLSAIYGELNKEAFQLALLESVFEGGYIKEGQALQDLANLLLMQEVPYKSAVILEKAIHDEKIKKDKKSLEILSRAWYLAGEYEKSLGPLEEAAEMSDNGDLYTRLASIYTSLARWSEVVDALDAGIKKGDLSTPGNIYLTRGIAQFKLGRHSDARQSFESAQEFEDMEEMAKQWEAHMDYEIRKMEALVSN